MTCGACGFESAANVKFCGQCGEPLPLTCAQCDARNPPGFKFCGECGASLSTRDKLSSSSPGA